jgi:hypothetical protein
VLSSGMKKFAITPATNPMMMVQIIPIVPLQKFGRLLYG